MSLSRSIVWVDESEPDLDAPNLNAAFDEVAAYTDAEVAAVRASLAAEVAASRAAMPSLVAPLVSGESLSGNNTTLIGGTIYLQRVVARRTGTLRDLMIYVQSGAGEVVAGVFDAGAAAPGVLTRLWRTLAAPVPASFGWRILGDPALPVVAGQHLYLAFGCSSGAATFGVTGVPAGAAAALPPSYLPGDGVTPRLIGTVAAAPLEVPATLANGAVANSFQGPILAARIA